jgi:uncharacterized protein YjdB
VTRRARRQWAGPVASLVLLACGGTDISDEHCLFDVGRVSPSTARLSVGDTLRFQVSAGPPGCLEAGLEPTAWRWSSPDTLIATIDSLTGLAQAVGLGQVLIRVHHAEEPGIGGEATFNVVAAAD